MKLLPYFQWISARLLGIFETHTHSPSITSPWSKAVGNLANLWSTSRTELYWAPSYGAADTCTVCC